MAATMQLPAASSGLDSTQARTHYQGREMQLYGANDPRFDGKSAYRDDFPAHQLPPRTTLARPTAAPSLPFDAASSYKADYPQHALEPRPPAHGGQYTPNSAVFDGTTSYRQNFQGQQQTDPAQRSTGRAPYTPSSAPFDGASSYKADFPKHDVAPRQAAHAAQYHANPAPFDGTSSYKAEFQAHQLEPRTPIRPHATPTNTAPFDGATSYNTGYPQHAIEPRPHVGAGPYTPNPAPFEGSTMYRDNFKAYEIDPAALQRHKGLPPVVASAPFDGRSSYKDDFKGWKLPARRPALGVQVLGDRTYVLIPAEAPLPAVGKQVFTTVHDNQPEICVLVLKGDAHVASRNNVIGQYDLKGLPPGPKGSARVEVSFFLSADNVLTATATDLDAARHAQWLRQGSMQARLHDRDVQAL